ncbi:MAG: glycosyltransferase [Clostridium sp.]|nr:glycosyltransferase [Clostridium sp.]
MVNVLISTYNGEKYIINQMESIEGQTYQQYHVYIRDDGSTDATLRIVQEFIEQNKLQNKYTLIKGNNIGFSQSFGELLKLAEKGDYWAFCDQDDYWYPKKIEYAVEWLEGRPAEKPLLYHGGFEIGNENLTEKKKYPVSKFNYTFQTALTSNVFFGFSIVINRMLYEQLKRVDYRKVKYHDWFAGMIVAAFGEYFMSDEVEAIHRQHRNNTSPLYFFKKIPDGLKLLKGDDIYTRNAREFYRMYADVMSLEQRQLCEWFLNESYHVSTAFRKAFYLRRWNPQLKVEIVLRILMLLGKI